MLIDRKVKSTKGNTMNFFKIVTPSSSAVTAFMLITCLGLVACSSSGGSSTSEDDVLVNDIDSNEDTNTSDEADVTNNSDNPNTNEDTNETDTESTNQPAGEQYLTGIDISTELMPSLDDSGMDYKLLGYRLHAGRILAVDVLATNKSDVVKSMGSCNADVFNGDELVEFTFSNFLGGAPLRPGDEMVASVFFRTVSEPSQVDSAIVDCNFTDLVTTGVDPAITYDFIEFAGPDDLGRILVNVQINNDSGESIKFSRCDFSARNGNRIVESARMEFNFGREIQPGEAYIGEGILILDFDEFESDSFKSEDLHCDYDLAS